MHFAAERTNGKKDGGAKIDIHQLSPDFAQVDERDMPATDCAIQELYEGIDAIYFTGKEFDPILHELKKTSGPRLEMDQLEQERFKLKRQMQVISKKITASIIKNSFDYNKNVENYDKIQKDAEELLHLIRELRRKIANTRRKCRALLAALASEYKKDLTHKLKMNFSSIRTLHKVEFRLRELMREGDIFTFVQIAVEAIDAMKEFLHFSSIRDLHKNFVRMLEAEKAKIDELLAALVKLFNSDTYAYLHAAYEAIGNLEETSVKLSQLFKSTIPTCACLVLAEFIRANESPPPGLEALSYNDLCKLIEPKHYLRALIEIVSLFVALLTNYHSILHFHMVHDEKQQNLSELDAVNGEDYSNDNDVEFADKSMTIVEKGVFQKTLLDNMLPTFVVAFDLCNSLLTNFDIIQLKFDQFLKIIEVSERFHKFGQLHFGYQSPKVASVLEKQSMIFFKHYHLERMDEMKMFLENETFTLCPVTVQFTIFDLPDFYFIKESNLFAAIEKHPEPCDVFNQNFVLIKQSDSITNDFLSELESIENNPSNDSRFQNSISCDSPEDEDMDFPGTFSKSMPNLCNTAINLLRIIGRYMKMSKLLQCTAEQMLDAILQLYNFFLFTMHACFCSDSTSQQQQQLFGKSFFSTRLRQLMESIERTYFLSSAEEKKIALSELSENPEVDASLMSIPTNNSFGLDDKSSLFSLAERIIGIESAIFIAKQMDLLRPFLENLLPFTENPKLESFYKTLPTAMDLLEATVGCVVTKVLSYQSILKQILSTEWNLGEIPTNHSAYVDFILEEFGEFKCKLSKLYPYVHICEELHQTIWSVLCMCIIRILVQAYSEAPKCTPEGRALQLLDVEHLCNKLEELSGIRPLPHRPHVENYIKAFYLPNEDLSKWIVHHTEYSLNQTTALLNASTNTRGTKKAPTMSKLLSNFLDASGIGEGSNTFF